MWVVDDFDIEQGTTVHLEWLVRNDDFEIIACCPTEEGARRIADLLNRQSK